MYLNLKISLLLLLSAAPLCMTATISQMIALAADERAMDQATKESNIMRIEMDILFTMEDWDAIYGQMGKRKKRKALRYYSRRWPEKTMPYEIEPGFTTTQLGEVQKAINEWEYYTCVQLKQRTTESDYVYMKNGGGCASYIGRIGGKQDIWLAPGCRYKGIVVHELGHALGYFHEQSRPDRDDYVTILEENIQSGKENNFNKYSTDVINTYQVQYDYTSVMHYGADYFSKNGQPTIQTRDPSKQRLIGNRSGLSFRDLQLANRMYECSELCNPVPNCPANSYVGKDCKCWCPGEPAKLCYNEPTEPPTPGPTDPPTTEPTDPPTIEPTDPPTTEPTVPPTTESTDPPTIEPTDPPITEPTDLPTKKPTISPTKSPDIILKYGGFCFAAFEEKKSKYEAENICNQWHPRGHLAWFRSEQEWAELSMAIAVKHKPRYWFTGLMKTNFGWSSGKDVGFVNFYGNKPNMKKNGCVFLDRQRGYKWIDAACTRKEASVCKAACSDECANCTFTYRGDCYFVEQAKMLFFEAEMNCAAKFTNGHLLWIDDHVENDYVMQELSTYVGVNNYFHIGLLLDNRWSYTSGYPVSFTMWGDNEPNRQHEICTVLDRNLLTLKYGWADLRCETKQSYICKAPCVLTESEKCDLIRTGPFPDSCIRQWMLDAGCSLDGTLLTTDITDITGLTVSEVKAVILATRKAAVFDPDAGRKCYGPEYNLPLNGKCDRETNGAHSLACLVKWWIDIGCSTKGTFNPAFAPYRQIEYWNRLDVSSVQRDMVYYRDSFPLACYGEEFEVDCEVRFKKGPHPQRCLLQWWYEAGCTGEGTASPMNKNDTIIWDNMTAESVRQDMAHVQQGAISSAYDEDGELYVSKCYGKSGLEMCACDSYLPDTTVPKVCLIKFWLEAGCSLNGTYSPHKLHNTHRWTKMSIKKVKQEILDLRDFAFQGDSIAAEECFGDTFKAGETCDDDSVQGPHKLTCLMKWWLEIGCKANAGASPASEYGKQLYKTWSSKSAQHIREKTMKQFKLKAYQNNSVNGLSYIYLCYGV